jgi:adenine deaminase
MENAPIEGNVVDVITGEIVPARIFHEMGVVTSVERCAGAAPGYLLPGFIDAHVHVDSSLLCPSRFAEAAVPRGTTAVVTDPHEIANVLGMPGIAYMRRDARSVPLRTFFTAPSCVPATPFETAGAAIGPAETRALLRESDVVALGEVMDYEGAVRGDPDVMAKIDAARQAGRPVDGHCPLLSGERLRAYVGRGISTDHECTSAEEALEKHALGMRILVRQGSVAKDLAALAPFAREHPFCLVSDDLLASDLLDGHLDAALRTAVSLGIDPLHAIRAVTLRPAEHYRLPLGVIAPGRMADVVRVGDLVDFPVEEVYIGGRPAARRGAPSFSAHPAATGRTISVSRKRSPDFALPAPGTEAVVRVITLLPDRIVTGSETATIQVRAGRALPDTDRDILAVAVVNRYRDAPVACGFVRGFGLRKGAIASSVAHDSHNIIAVGADPDDMAGAVDEVIRLSGGLCLRAGDAAWALPLPIAGLMSPDAPGDVSARVELLHRKARELGCSLPSPFMAMSFLSLLVIPRLKIGDRGLFDVDALRFVEPVLSVTSRGSGGFAGGGPSRPKGGHATPGRTP